MTEVWKDIDGYEGLYQVSNLGRVRSLDRELKNKRDTRFFKGRLLKPNVCNRGYTRIMLRSNGKRYSVHRLVAQTFIPNPENKAEVNHIDNNPSNNIISNLEWVTREENIAHCYKQGRQHHNLPILRGLEHMNSKLNPAKVKLIRDLKGIKTYRQLGEMFGVSHPTIKCVMLGRTWKQVL